MPTIDISLTDLEKLAGKKLPRDINELNKILEFAKSEVENLDGNDLKLSIEDSNRPDLWCVEGVARQIQGFLGVETGLKKYSAKKTKLNVFVNKKLEKIRPHIACAVIKNVKLTNEIIEQLMQQQDKIDGTFGRKRRKTSIGLYDFDQIKFPLRYDITKPNENAFAPLTFTKKLTPAKILKEHPKGIEYAHILSDFKEYPIFKDDAGKILSMPPIINSNDLGQITEKTKNILIEVTGTNHAAVNAVLRIMALSLVDRGGELHEVKINYPYANDENTPDLESKEKLLDVNDVNKLLGTSFSPTDIIKLLKKYGYDADTKNRHIKVIVPSYRTDIMHDVDLIEDVAIAHSYSNFEPLPLELLTTGQVAEIQKLTNKIRGLIIGQEAQEVLNFTLTNKNVLFKKMNLPQSEVVEIENPVSLTYSCLRSFLLPGLLEFLSKNTKKEYPQKIFEVGKTVMPLKTKTREETHLAYLSAHKGANFTEAKQALDALFRSLGKEIQVKPTAHKSFIPGRAGAILLGNKEIGVIGEISPQVISNWRLEVPVVGFEINISALEQ
ncbi:phenylalanine--tRNA ligase subunit beta [Candidatus Woesearchaeota archaeon]|nr:phenylalanine--tRNA ligase subunit beta [Candidatus Woesearchaeota archaeon]